MSKTGRTALASRVREIRRDLFGEHGGPLLAERVGVPFRTWVAYEAGGAMPALIILRLIELVPVNTLWLSLIHI